jgi:hypothetical protein
LQEANVKRILSFSLGLILLALLTLLPGLGAKPSTETTPQVLAKPTHRFKILEPMDGFEIDSRLVQPGETSWLLQCANDVNGRFIELRQRTAGPGETFPPGSILDMGGGRWGVIERGQMGQVNLSDGTQIPFEQATRLTWVENDVRLELLSNLPRHEIIRLVNP